MVDSRKLIDELRAEVLSGNISCDDVIKRLTVAIEVEYQKNEPNQTFIDTCEDLLWEIGTKGQQKFVSANDRYLATIEQYSQKTSKRKPYLRIAKRCALVFAAFAFLLIISQGAFHIGWFTKTPSPDEQQYIIQGHSIDVDFIARSIAAHEEYDSLQTDDWDEYIDFLGFVPSIVNPDVFSATVVRYIAFIEPDSIMLAVQYEIPDSDSPIVMTEQYYLDVDEAYFMMEQDNVGSSIFINNVAVYMSTNMNNVSFSWVNHNVVYKLAGNILPNEGLKIISEFIGGK